MTDSIKRLINGGAREVPTPMLIEVAEEVLGKEEAQKWLNEPR